MKKTVGLFFGLVVGLCHIGMAGAVDLAGGGSETNGFCYWSDAENWRGGALPGAQDAARLRADCPSALYLDVDAAVKNLVVHDDVHARIKGTGRLSLDSYLSLSFPNTGLTLMDAVTVSVGNRIRLSTGTTELTLNDRAALETKGLSFDAADARLVMTLAGDAVYSQLVSPQLTENMADGTKVVLNDRSVFNAETRTAEQIYDGWIAAGATLYLNDSAAIRFKSNRSNMSFIKLYNEAGFLVINGKTNAVNGVDYTYVDGVLKAGSAGTP